MGSFFRVPSLLVTEPGALKQLPEIIRQLGNPTSVFVVTDPGLVKVGLLERLKPLLSAEPTVFSAVEPDPTLATAEACRSQIVAAGAELVIGFGGGSAMDVAKVATAAASAGLPVAEFAGRAFPERKIRLIQIPTTSGTGSEATDRGIFTLPDGMKQGFLSPYLIADCALVDPELTLSLPPAMTAATGMDALTHAIEAYTSTQATPLTDTLALAAIERIGRSLRIAVHHGRNLTARTEMAEASLWAGIAFNNGGLGICHALAMALGARFHVAHGIANAILLPFVMRFNAAANPERFTRVAAALGEQVDGLSAREGAQLAVDAVFALARDVSLPNSLVEVGVDPAAIPLLAEAGFGIRRLVETNPRTCTQQELARILEQACAGLQAG